MVAKLNAIKPRRASYATPLVFSVLAVLSRNCHLAISRSSSPMI
jgi:hypothetical protein